MPVMQTTWRTYWQSNLRMPHFGEEWILNETDKIGAQLQYSICKKALGIEMTDKWYTHTQTSMWTWKCDCYGIKGYIQTENLEQIGQI
jgi:hypothetical protein